ncbi:MAG: TetR family transcriptional regulator C-terminal domain-containing protein [Sulfitobacter sp.]
MQQKNKSKTPTRIQIRNREAILTAGLEVFSQYGFRGATLDQVAAAAGMSKPNVLYYFASKEEIYTLLLEGLLATWLEPLREIDDNGDPVEELVAYMHRKLEMSRNFPRESRLFANEMLQGAPRMIDHLKGPLKDLLNEKAVVFRRWQKAGQIGAVNPHHLIFSIWALTQHYADFDVQVRAVLGEGDPYDDAAAHLEHMFRRSLAV